MFSERSDRRSSSVHGLGPEGERVAIAARLGLDVERVASAPSVAAIELALFHVLGDPGDEVLVAASADAIVREVAEVSGLDAVPLETLDAAALFEAAGERTRALVIGAADVDAELVAMLGELDLPLLAPAAALALRSLFVGEAAPLALVVGEADGIAWLAVLGPADRAEPLLGHLERFAHVFFARAGGGRP